MCRAPSLGMCSDSNNAIYLRSDFGVQSGTNGIKVTRSIFHWTQHLAAWSDLCTDISGVVITNAVTNVFYGLLYNEVYQVTDNGVARGSVTSDVNGSLSFTITLTNEAHNIRVQGGPSGTIFYVR